MVSMVSLVISPFVYFVWETKGKENVRLIVNSVKTQKSQRWQVIFMDNSAVSVVES